VSALKTPEEVYGKDEQIVGRGISFSRS